MSWCTPFPCVHSVRRGRARASRGYEAMASLQMHVVKLGTCLAGPPPFEGWARWWHRGWGSREAGKGDVLWLKPMHMHVRKAAASVPHAGARVHLCVHTENAW